MANSERGERTQSPVRLPAILFLVFVALVAGTLIWLTLASPGWKRADQAAGPHMDIPVKIALPPAEPAKKKPETEKTAEPATEQPGTEKTAEPATEKPGTEKTAEPATEKPETEKTAEPATEKTAEPEMEKTAEPAAEKTAEPAAEKPETEKTAEPTPSRERIKTVPNVERDSDLLLPPPMPDLPRVQPVTPLATAPDPALVQQSAAGPLPIISADGRMPWRAYARPFDQTNRRPRIAIVLTGLGINARVTGIAVHRLPGAVTLAFVPYGERLHDWISQARGAGHEVLLAVPMEPKNFPREDPGPQAMLLSLTAAENLKRLDWAMSRAHSYVGITNFMGSNFTKARKQLRPMMNTLKARGLMFLDSYSTASSAASDMAGRIGVPWVNNEIFIDNRPASAAIDAKLKKLEDTAREFGRAVAIGNPYPVTLERVARWAVGIKKRGLILAPISAMATVPGKK